MIYLKLNKKIILTIIIAVTIITSGVFLWHNNSTIPTNADGSFIKWVDFDLTASTMRKAIDIDVKTVSDQTDNIRGAMEEQDQGSKQILEAVGLLNEITQQVKNGSVEMLEGSKEVIQESDNL